MSAWLRKLLLAAVGVAALALVVYAFLPKPVDVDVATVRRGPLQVTVDREGKTRIRERYVVSAPLTGRLQRVELEPGDPVAAGRTIVASLEPPDPTFLDERTRAQAEARVKAATATKKQAGPNLERARAAHNFARTELERATRMRSDRTLSPQEHEAAIHRERVALEELKSAQFGVQIADFELELAEAALLRTKPRSPGEAENGRFDIRSPIDGRVLRVLQESATVVNAGASLLELGDPNDLEIEIDVLSSDAVKVRPGAKVRLEHWGGDEPLPARVRLVEPAAFTKVSALGVEEQRVWVIADFDGPPEQRKTLGHAYRVEARIVVWEAEDLLLAPAGAFFRRGDDQAVYLVVGGRVEERVVRVGRSNGIDRQILGGLAEGDVVVVHPSDKVLPGVAVVPR
jgi:HlyD family secretion protein